MDQIMYCIIKLINDAVSAASCNTFIQFDKILTLLLTLMKHRAVYITKITIYYDIMLTILLYYHADT